MSMHHIAFALILLTAPASAERLFDGPVTIDAPLSEQYTACFEGPRQ
jgi:hypothetical protein